jgi:hypothetical protein
VCAIPLAVAVYVVAMALIHYRAIVGPTASEVGFILLKPAFFLIGELLVLGPGFVHVSGVVATYAWVFILVAWLRSAMHALGKNANRGDG